MIKNHTQKLIDFLNEVVKLDPYAVAELLTVKVECNKALAEHPTIQVHVASEDPNELTGLTFLRPGTSRVGILGILNGFCGVYEYGPKKNWGPIAARYGDGKLIGFELVKNE